jgi:hypothetical protein
MIIQKRIFLLTLFVFLCFLPLPSIAEEGSFSLNFWPLFQYTDDPINQVKEIEGLGPFFSWKKSIHKSQWGIRPLLCVTEDETVPLWRLELLYPFGKYQVKEDEKKGYLALLSLFREENLDGEKRWDFQFFPFFIGETRKGENYFGLFPIFGTLLDRFGKEEIRFYLWPLYGESLSDGDRTTHILWPFISFTEGEKKRGYRFWPCYGRKEEKGISQTEFYAWPIFMRQIKGLDTEDPIKEWMVFPFYVTRESRRFESRTFLWPFFSYTRDHLSGFEQWDLPYPFFQSLKGEGLKGIRIFPFYGHKEKEGEMRRTFFLYPVYQLEEYQIGDLQEKTLRILLLSRIRIGENEKGIEKERSLRIWPFFDYEKKETGDEEFSFFYLFPFKDEGFERNLFPLFRIFRWEKNAQGDRSTNLLWGFYKRKKNGELDSWEVAHLIGLRKGKGWNTVSFLKGLFWYKNDGKINHLRLFYLPFHIHWSRSNPSPPLEKGEEKGDSKSLKEELSNGFQEDWDFGDWLACSGEDSFQF